MKKSTSIIAAIVDLAIAVVIGQAAAWLAPAWFADRLWETTIVVLLVAVLVELRTHIPAREQ